jgi:hypothetical protein
MKSALCAAVLCLSAAACAAQQGSTAQPNPAQGEACRDSVTGSPAMPVSVMRESERHYWPGLIERQEYRLTMLQERLGARLREGRPFPTRIDDLSPPVVEVPWLSTCDAWGHRVRIARSDREYELRSAGPDGVFGNGDDIVKTGLVPRS